MKPKTARARLLAKALSYPETREDHPWGDTVVKVKEKVFVFLGPEGDELGFSVKLPGSAEAALTMFACAKPTGYGLGKSGWVSFSFGPKDDVPLGLVLEWLDESFRAVAPKRLLKAMDVG